MDRNNTELVNQRLGRDLRKQKGTEGEGTRVIGIGRVVTFVQRFRKEMHLLPSPLWPGGG